MPHGHSSEWEISTDRTTVSVVLGRSSADVINFGATMDLVVCIVLESGLKDLKEYQEW